jgi:protein-tyrosine-phosphatase/predicted ATP-grasp superfamily ATP-dependent carboligase
LLLSGFRILPLLGFEVFDLMIRPVLLLNAVSHVVVAVARSLTRRGIDVAYADIRGNGKAPASRAIKHFIQLPDFETCPEFFREALAEAIKKYEFDMLIPCSDPGLVAALDHYDWLCSRLHVGCPEPAIVRRVLDKSQTLDLAVQCGIAVPERFQIRDIDALEHLCPDIRFPLIAKPLTKEDETRHTFKMRYFRVLEELRDAFILNPDFGTNHLLQEYCTGEGVGVELLLHHGEPVAAFQHRRLKELPISGGGSVTCISEPVNTLLFEQSVKLLRQLGWEGVAMVEFKRDIRSNRAVLMEVNGRYWGSLPLAIRAGIDFPLYEWQLAHGEEPRPPSEYPVGMRFRWLAGDIRRIASLLHDGSNDSFPRSRLPRELVSFVADFRYGTCPALGSWSDPMPAVVETTAAAKKCVGAVVKRFGSRVKSVRDSYDYHGGAVLLSALRLRTLSKLGLKWRRSLPPLSKAPSILFVCHGNIIRSAMAEALLRKQVLGSRVLANLSIESAGLSRNPEAQADRRARLIVREFGISLDDHRPSRLTQQQVEGADVVFIMDALNEAYLTREFPEAKNKIVYLGNLNPATKSPKNVEIEDPYSGTLANFRNCFQHLEQCTQGLLKLLEKAAWSAGEKDGTSSPERMSAKLRSELNTDLQSNRSTT